MVWVLLVVCFFLFLTVFISKINKRAFVRLFDEGNCIVSGLRGRGKDFAFCVVVNSRKKNYISNIQYSDPKKKYQRFDFDIKVWELSGNGYTDFSNGTVKKYVYPYPDNIDYYLSDVGVYFPAQYCNELVKRYSSAPFFQALSRHLGDCNVHCNVQNMPRVWDKIREQSDIYICMDKCRKIFGKLFYLRSYVYDKEEACNAHLKPPKYGWGGKAKDRRVMFETQNGSIRKFGFFARLPYTYDSRYFKKLLENGCIEYEDKKKGVKKK